MRVLARNEFYMIFQIFSSYAETATVSAEGDLAKVLPDYLRLPINNLLPKVRAQCTQMGLGFALAALTRMERGILSPDYRCLALAEDARDFVRRSYEESQGHLFLHLGLDQARYYRDYPTGWEPVMDKFPSCSFDIEEASKCFALNRFTATAFHLMRVMEVGLRSLGKSLNDPGLEPRSNPTWERILRKCRDELDKPLSQRASEWRADEPFFSGAALRLAAVKDAWRNPTIHIEIIHTEETALDVFNHVQSCMRHLATKLTD